MMSRGESRMSGAGAAEITSSFFLDCASVPSPAVHLLKARTGSIKMSVWT